MTLPALGLILTGTVSGLLRRPASFSLVVFPLTETPLSERRLETAAGFLRFTCPLTFEGVCVPLLPLKLSLETLLGIATSLASVEVMLLIRETVRLFMPVTVVPLTCSGIRGWRCLLVFIFGASPNVC